jgi:predicted amino acid-binding ACT domain protein
MKTYPQGNYSQNFALTMILLPSVIAIIILLIGSDIARAFSLAGAFSIIRFRSAPGEPKDIAFVLFSMASGLAAGVGAYLYAGLFTLVLCLVMYVLSKTNFGSKKDASKVLKITVPEDMVYEEEFDQLFSRYEVSYQLNKVKTTALGSLIQLEYLVKFPKSLSLQEFMNEIRAKNSNLNISINMIENDTY